MGLFSEMFKPVCSAACGAGMAQCGPGASRQCIPERWFCDRDNDCGDNSDEDPEMCGSYIYIYTV